MSGRLSVDVSGLGPGETRAVTARGPDGRSRSLLVCNAEGSFYALENRCPHAAVPLEGGALRGFVLECPFHGGRLDVRDGRPAAQPIRRPAATFRVRRADADTIEIDLDA